MENQKLGGPEWMGGPDWVKSGPEEIKNFFDGWESSKGLTKEDFWFWAKTSDFEKLFRILQEIVRPMWMGKKTRVVVDYDPEKEETTFRYYHLDEQKETSES